MGDSVGVHLLTHLLELALELREVQMAVRIHEAGERGAHACPTKR
jgi:hypothetical protein